MAIKRLNPIELEKIRQGLTPRSEAPELYVPEVIGATSINKGMLLEIARSGGLKPKHNSKDQTERKLWIALMNYSNKKSNTYDASFKMEIKEIRPDWFADTAALNKERILEIARSGNMRPKKSSKNESERKLAVAIVKYTNEASRSHDKGFEKLLKKLRPDWFADTASNRKQELLMLASSGASKPGRAKKNDIDRKLGQSLSGYIRKDSDTYDQEFSKKIKALRPDWFADTAALNKVRILEIASSGARRPNQKSHDKVESKLAYSLSSYISVKSGNYDPDFTVEIKTRRPDWFKVKSGK